MLVPSLLLAVVLAAPEAAASDEPEPATPAAVDGTPADAATPATPADATATGAMTPAAPVPEASPGRKAKTGRGLLIAGGVLTGLGVVGRIALEAYWSTAAQIVPTDPFARWSTANLVFVTNWNNLMFFGPGLGLLTAGAYRRGAHEASLGKVRDAQRMRRVGIGLLGGGLGLWVLSRALFLPIAEACPSNRCAYTTLETTFWIGAGAIFAGAAHLAYGTGYLRAGARARVRVQVAPSFGPGFGGLALAGRF
ncbi:hypothetical protein [Nannocystis punicea]|uniref:Uncharacterized protein n=1 Tax=Nannocystis punicea TaxID=2995304 RepID=A0ABY7GTF7_9BACT|nr:hypothetical protein [Nannocystis poenicansa]WAS90228.1 hypothetical protein O0S08_28875 [Nannocystis poenicansa]